MLRAGRISEIYAGIKRTFPFFLFFNHDIHLTGEFCALVSPYIRLLNSVLSSGRNGRELRSRKILRSINYKTDKYICKLCALSLFSPPSPLVPRLPPISTSTVRRDSKFPPYKMHNIPSYTLSLVFLFNSRRYTARLFLCKIAYR